MKKTEFSQRVQEMLGAEDGPGEMNSKIDVYLANAEDALLFGRVSIADENVRKAHAAASRFGLQLEAIAQLARDVQAEGDGEPSPPEQQQAGESWNEWHGSIDVNTLNAEDARFASMIMSDGRYGPFFWVDKIGGKQEDVKRWVQSTGNLAANWDPKDYIARGGSLVVEARKAGVSV